ncbi:MAG: CHASE2 domain-containing protein [Caulobacterales bacterium]|nr:CHASE2 domain-containing protein [Caulobacterales bacterium]
MTGSRSKSDSLVELDVGARLRVRAGGLLAALVAALLLAAAGEALRQPLFDLYQRILPAPAPSDRVVVVVVDARSIAKIGGWPWSRYTMARLAEQIAGRGASAVGFDFLFPEKDRQNPADFAGLYYELAPATAAEVRQQKSMDDVFAQVIGRWPVVLARGGVEKDSYDSLDKDEIGLTAAPFPPEARFVGPQPPAIPSYPGALVNLDILDGAAAGHGLANGQPDRDGVVRRVPLLGRVAGVLTPSLALDLVRTAEAQDTIRLQGDRRRLWSIEVGRHTVPVQAGGQVMLRFTARPPRHGEAQLAYPAVSAADVLGKGVPPDAFKGKIVLVGLAAAGTSDVVNAVHDGRTYGVFVQAQAVDAVLSGRGLQRPTWTIVIEAGLGLAMVLISWFGVPRAPFLLVVTGAVGEIGAVFAASGWAFQHNILLDPIPMLVPGAASSAVTVAMLFVEGRRVQRRLREALEEERLAAAKISWELGMASQIQSGMLLPRKALGQITPAAEIDAVLQPAREVGGDLYDAFLLDERRLCFLIGDVTGKGVPASLFMALAKALGRSYLMRPDIGLDAAVAGINAELARDNTEVMAVSLLVGVLHLADGRVELCCAGHENPVVVSADGSARELKLEGGLPLGVDETIPCPVERYDLAFGETLVIFTDGLTEAQSPDGRLLGHRAAMAALGAAAGAALPEMIDQAVAAVRAFEAGGEPSDDLTLLAVRRCAT